MGNVDPREAHLSGNKCYCRSCNEFFTTVRNFDRHLIGRGRPTCAAPADVGLVRDKYGYWQQPAGEFSYGK